MLPRLFLPICVAFLALPASAYVSFQNNITDNGSSGGGPMGAPWTGVIEDSFASNNGTGGGFVHAYASSVGDPSDPFSPTAILAQSTSTIFLEFRLEDPFFGPRQPVSVTLTGQYAMAYDGVGGTAVDASVSQLSPGIFSFWSMREVLQAPADLLPTGRIKESSWSATLQLETYVNYQLSLKAQALVFANSRAQAYIDPVISFEVGGNTGSVVYLGASAANNAAYLPFTELLAPEPSSITLLGLAGVGFLTRRPR